MHKSPASERVHVEMLEWRQVPESPIHKAPVSTTPQVPDGMGRERPQGEKTHTEGIIHHRVRRRDYFARGVEDTTRRVCEDRRDELLYSRAR